MGACGFDMAFHASCAGVKQPEKRGGRGIVCGVRMCSQFTGT